MSCVGAPPQRDKDDQTYVEHDGRNARLPVSWPGNQIALGEMIQEDPEEVAERQRNYKQRRRERGEVRVSVWVPATYAQRLRDIAAMWRSEAEIEDGKTRTPKIEIPKVEIPEHPPPRWAWLELGREEIALHKMLNANGGEWHGQRKLWRIRSDLVEPLGLRNRVVKEEELPKAEKKKAKKR